MSSPESENCPALSPDGRVLFFGRGERNDAGEVLSRDIYYVDASVLRR